MREPPRKLKWRKRRRHSGHVLPREYLEYAALRLAVLLIRAVPVEVASGLMGKAWRLFGPWTWKHQRVQTNLQIALPHLDEAGRRRIAREQWENLGRTLAETFHVQRFVDEPGRSELAIDPALDARLRQRGGQIFVSMHSANWEVTAMPLQRFRTLAGMYQVIKNPLVDAYIAALRKKVFPGGLFTKGVKTPGHVMSWIREGNAACLLGDHYEGRGIPVTVFGRRTKANPFPAMVARRLGVPLIAGRALRRPGSRFTVELVEVVVPVTDEPKRDVAAATQALQEQFEGWIRERPGEWMWVQDRWRAARSSAGPAGRSTLPACQRRAEASILEE